MRIIGKLQAFQGKVSIIGYHVKLLEDTNELTYHLLECVYANEMYKRRTGQGGAGVGVSQGNALGFVGPKATGASLNDTVTNQGALRF